MTGLIPVIARFANEMSKTKQSPFYPVLILFMLSIFTAGCAPETGSSNAPIDETAFITIEGWERFKGIGPVTTITLDSVIHTELAKTGASIFRNKCTTCHKADKRFIGPPPKGILERRTPEWVMNMILNPEEMLKKDPIAILVAKEYQTMPMTNQQITTEEARALLEYFRTL
jgi:mono/diheme cytochrome c family protein